MEENDIPQQQQPLPSLTVLKTLCILTFVGSGLSLISYGTIAFLYNYITANLNLFLNASPFSNEQTRELLQVMINAGRYFFIFTAILYAVSFAGALLMWRLRKAGFHLYAASQLFILIVPLAMIKGFPMPGLTIFITILFIWMYSRYLKVMN